MVPGWFFMVFHGFSWFFMDPGWFFMVFLQNVPAQTVSWPNDQVLVRRPEGSIGPSAMKQLIPSFNAWDSLNILKPRRFNEGFPLLLSQR